MKITVRPATLDELRNQHPDFTTSYRAWTVEVDGEPSGCIGLALTRPYAQLFSSVSDALRPGLKSLTVMRLVKRVKTLIEERGLPVLAIRDLSEPASGQILERLGFKPFGEIEGQSVYLWSRG